MDLSSALSFSTDKAPLFQLEGDALEAYFNELENLADSWEQKHCLPARNFFDESMLVYRQVFERPKFEKAVRQLVAMLQQNIFSTEELCFLYNIDLLSFMNWEKIYVGSDNEVLSFPDVPKKKGREEKQRANDQGMAQIRAQMEMHLALTRVARALAERKSLDISKKGAVPESVDDEARQLLYNLEYFYSNVQPLGRLGENGRGLSSRKKVAFLFPPTELQDGENMDKKFEVFCGDVLDYLFADCFKDYNRAAQSYSSDDTQIRDHVITNRPQNQDSFWASLLTNYGTNKIVFEVKFVQEPGTSEVDSACKYILGGSNDSCGKVVFLISLNPLTTNGYKRMASLASGDAPRYIVPIDYAAIEDMISIKSNGGDPAEVIREKLSRLNPLQNSPQGF